MADYEFVTRWTFDAPLARVWDEIYHPERWSDWWKAVLAVSLIEPGDELGVGTLRRYTWRGMLPYRLTFDMRTTLVEPLARLEGIATGELDGVGKWTFDADGGKTRVLYEWTVRATKKWMQLTAPVARPLFEWNHDVVMRWGFEGLSERLAVEASTADRR